MRGDAKKAESLKHLNSNSFVSYTIIVYTAKDFAASYSSLFHSLTALSDSISVQLDQLSNRPSCQLLRIHCC